MYTVLHCQISQKFCTLYNTLFFPRLTCMVAFKVMSSKNSASRLTLAVARCPLLFTTILTSRLAAKLGSWTLHRQRFLRCRRVLSSAVTFHTVLIKRSCRTLPGHISDRATLPVLVSADCVAAALPNSDLLKPVMSEDEDNPGHCWPTEICLVKKE